MKVSAISVATIQASVSNKSYKSKNDKNSVDVSFTEIVTHSGKSSKSNDISKIYDVINEWKDFCHKQIMSGKIDIVV